MVVGDETKKYDADIKTSAKKKKKMATEMMMLLIMIEIIYISQENVTYFQLKYKGGYSGEAREQSTQE